MAPLFGKSHSQYGDPNMRRLRLAEALMLKGTDSSPVEHWAQGLGRMGQAAIGGYLSHKADEDIKAKEERRRLTLAEALKAGQGEPAPAAPTLAGGEAAATGGTGVAQQGTKGDLRKMAAILAGNEDTAPLGLQVAMQEIQAGREDERFNKRFGMEREARREDMGAQQQFQKDMAAINQAFQSGQLSQQQAFAAKQAAEQRAFTAAESEKNRTTQLQAAVPNQVLTGLKIQEKQKEIEDAAKAKTESVVSVDRMIRSIDDLANHPGREFATGQTSILNFMPGTEGASFDAKLETLKSQAFLPMVAQLKGMGQLSDAEGKKLTAAIGALDPKMTEREFLASLNEIKADLEAARKRMGAPAESTVPRAPNAAPDINALLNKYAP